MVDTIDALLSRSEGAPYPYSPLQAAGIFLVVFFTLAATITCALRVYSRYITRCLGLDDWLTVAATLLTINQGWSAIVFMRLGYVGIHTYDVPPNDTEGLSWYYNWLCLVFYTPILWLVKISILVFLLRLGGLQNQRVRIAIYCMIAVVTSIMIANQCVIILQCNPAHVGWTTPWFEREALGYHCIDAAAFTISAGALAIFTDLVLLIVPFWIFLDLRINKRMRNALIGVFMLGIVVTVLSGVRLYFMWGIFYQVMEDPTYSIGFVISVVETDLAIVASSLPALWPLGRRWFPSMDDKLGINRVHQADIEVQDVTAHGNLTIGSQAPRVKVTWVRTRKTRGEVQAEQLQQHRHSGSPNMMAAVDSRNSRHGHDEGNSRDGLVPRTSSTTAPLPSSTSHEKCSGEDEEGAGDYFGNFSGALAAPPATTTEEEEEEEEEEGQASRAEAERDDSYHGAIATRGHTSPYGNHHYSPFDGKTAYYSSETPGSNEQRQSGYRGQHHGQQKQVESGDSTAYTLPVMPEPALFRLTLPARAKTAPSAFTLSPPPSKREGAGGGPGS
ncbi:hypothetical protein GE09DRAFT_86452 [Coniochaeta sp. 2T2.1]|nr:hypothetical protein GE09DRAFT_86452 [Coniochaeta sp. 2T2.1]